VEGLGNRKSHIVNSNQNRVTSTLRSTCYGGRVGSYGTRSISPACQGLAVLPLAFQPGERNQAGLLTTGLIGRRIMKKLTSLIYVVRVLRRIRSVLAPNGRSSNAAATIVVVSGT
jgi:hypothetical protein